MTFALSIPSESDPKFQLGLEPGQVLFLLGANGTGKSSLMHRFYRNHQKHARRITAHRQTWLHSNTIMLTHQSKKVSEERIRSRDREPDSRWMESDPGARSSIAIFDLVESENLLARMIADAVRNEDIDSARKQSLIDSPLKVMNDLLRSAGMPITIEISSNAAITARKNDGDPYSIAELSDGERNALLIATDVLTVDSGTLLLIDEPERHLHRSIISPLLTQLFAKRPDCAFVVSTHEIMLPLDNPSAQTLLIRGCNYNGTSVSSWDVDLLHSASEIDDDLKRDILGARRRILFIEGKHTSLDKPLYSVIFPDVSIIAKGNCRDVERAVLSIRDAQELHTLAAFGLVDNDRRPQDDIDRLREAGVYTTAVISVESVYYHPNIQGRVARRHADTTGADVANSIAEARSAALEAITPHILRLSARVAEKQVRERFFAFIPNMNQMAAPAPVNVTIDVPEIVDGERSRLQEAITAGDLLLVLSRYPVRETPALDRIAQSLGFRGRAQYEAAVRKLLKDDVDALHFARGLFGGLAAAIGVDASNDETSLTDTPPDNVGLAEPQRGS